jgi:uncharacterized membrane protein YkvA (DUF1232 family)
MLKMIQFVRDLAEDQRIPLRNRLVLGGLVAYLMTPVDIIPDFIPILGWLDDAFVTLVVLDYVFNSADTEMILEHYPWDKQNFRKVKSYVERLSWLVPPRVKRLLFSEASRRALQKSSASQESIPEKSGI